MLAVLTFISTSCKKDQYEKEDMPKSYFDYSDFVADGLVAYFPFNEGNIYASDEYECTVNGTRFTSDRFGNSAGALLFDGDDDYIEIPQMDRFNRNSGTICFWLRVETDEWETSRAIISKIDDNNRGYSIAATNSENVYFETHIDGGASGSLDFGKDISNKDEYFFLAVTFTDSKIRTFFQGKPSYGFSITSEWLFSNNLPIIIGKGVLDNQADFSGEIDDILIYNRDLTEEEINRLYNWR